MERSGEGEETKEGEEEGVSEDVFLTHMDNLGKEVDQQCKDKCSELKTQTDCESTELWRKTAERS